MVQPTMLALDDPRRVDNARDLLERAEILVDHGASANPADQFSAAYLAALRGAGAVLALHERSSRVGSRSAWLRLPKVAPDMQKWATYFAGFSDLRADLTAGLQRTVSSQVAAEIARQVDDFLDDVDAEIIRVEQGRTAAHAA